MARTDLDQWWLEPSEQIVLSVGASAKYQYADSIIRKTFPGTFYLTDRRFVAANKRSAKKQTLPMDVPLDRIKAVEVLRALKMRGSYYRPLPGRRLVHLDIDHRGRNLVVALVLPRIHAEEWAASLTSVCRPESV